MLPPIEGGSARETRPCRSHRRDRERGRLRGAATLLGKTQPALTKALRLVEDELATRIFTRAARGVELTEIGQVVIARLGLSPDSVIGARQAECGFDAWIRDDGLWGEGPDGHYDQ